MYWRVLRLRHVHPTSWQRAAFFEGSLAAAAVLVLADLASAWLLLVLPVAVALVVKAHDVLVGWLGDVTEATGDELVTEPAESAFEESEAEGEREPEPVVAAEPVTEPEVEPEPNVRIVGAPRSRAARSRPGAAAARAQVSAAQRVRQRHAEPTEPDGSG
jgi:hypothetical protein